MAAKANSTSNPAESIVDAGTETAEELVDNAVDAIRGLFGGGTSDDEDDED